MIIKGAFIKSTFAQFSPFLTLLPLRFPKKIEDVRFWPDPLLLLPLTHPLTGLDEWGDINFEHFRDKYHLKLDKFRHIS